MLWCRTLAGLCALGVLSCYSFLSLFHCKFCVTFYFLFHFILYVLSILSSANKINDDDGLYSVSCDYKNIRATIALRAIVARRQTGRQRQTTKCVLPLTYFDLFRSLRTALTLIRPCSPAELMLFVFDSINVA